MRRERSEVHREKYSNQYAIDIFSYKKKNLSFPVAHYLSAENLSNVLTHLQHR